MATEPTREKYPDLPYSNFPVEEDYFARMKDVGADTVKYVKQYNTYAEAENWDGCSNVLANHPEVISCLFDAEKFNQLRDSILATQRYYLNDVKADLNNIREYINTVKNEKVGIDDTDENEQSKLTTYSAYKIYNQLKKVDESLEKAKTKISENASAIKTVKESVAPVILSDEFIDKWTKKLTPAESTETA